MSSFEEKLSKIRQGYNEQLNVDDKEQMAQEEEDKKKKKSVIDRLREMFDFSAPPPKK